MLPMPSEPPRKMRSAHVQKRIIAVYRREPREILIGHLECLNHGRWSGWIDGGITSMADTAEECADKLSGVWHQPIGT